jgi:predicted 3-demethylubiquinone-9 3-methyltransferase (glyoxalase superfamily)
VATLPKITPNLWFDSQAEEAARFYTSVFDDSEILRIAYYGEAGYEIHHMKAGTVLTVDFRIAGQQFVALNGGPNFKFTEAISFIVDCEDQAEFDYFWDRLGEGGDPSAQQCGWLKDRFGLSWQVVPSVLNGLMSGPDHAATERVMTALLAMKKLVVADLEAAYRG